MGRKDHILTCHKGIEPAVAPRSEYNQWAVQFMDFFLMYLLHNQREGEKRNPESSSL